MKAEPRFYRQARCHSRMRLSSFRNVLESGIRMGEASAKNAHRLRAGMVGLGMIFDETYRPFFEQMQRGGMYRRDFGVLEVELTAVASRTGSRAARYRGGRLPDFACFAGADAVAQLLRHGVDVVCVATPD